MNDLEAENQKLRAILWAIVEANNYEPVRVLQYRVRDFNPMRDHTIIEECGSEEYVLTNKNGCEFL